MGLGIIIPVLVLLVVVPMAFWWAKTNLKDAPAKWSDEPVVAPAARLTSTALRELPTPPWRVVYEIAADKLGGIEHVLIGPAGVFGLRTTMDPMPSGDPDPEPDARAVAEAAIVRGDLDDALKRCAMTSDRLVEVHWGAGRDGRPSSSSDVLPGVTAVDGRSLTTWASSLGTEAMSPAQVDLAWQTVVTAIGRPDPLS
jgi:hypothetical protein